MTYFVRVSNSPFAQVVYNVEKVMTTEDWVVFVCAGDREINFLKENIVSVDE